MPEVSQNEFRGWAKVEVMGHQSHVGFVTTETYGQAVMFRIDQPEIPAGDEEITEYSRYDDDGNHCPKGSIVRRKSVEGVTVLVGSGSIYRIIPCTKEVALASIRGARAPFMLVKLPETAALPTPCTACGFDRTILSAYGEDIIPCPYCTKPTDEFKEQL